MEKIDTIAENEEEEEAHSTKEPAAEEEKVEISPISGKVLARIDEEVSTWVADALALRRGEKSCASGESRRPPMHAAPLDVMGTPDASPAPQTDENVNSLAGSMERLDVQEKA